MNAIFFQDDVPIPLFSMYTRGVRLVTGRVNARAVLPKVLDLIVDGSLEPGSVTDAVVPWADAVVGLLDQPRKLVIRR